MRIGQNAAARMLASRVGDGFEDTSIHYSKPAAIGTWQPVPTAPPAPPADMLAAWLGSLDPLVLDTPVPVNGPDAMTDADYTADFLEVRDYGRAGSTFRSNTQTDTAYFFNSNSATMIGDAMIRKLEAAPIDLRTTALFFARMHASMTDAIIRCWELKRDVGFWRPFQAIAGAASDGNPGTPAPVLGDPVWTSLLTNPPYSDYVSGHGCLTSPAVETIRMMFGESTALDLVWNIPGSTQVPSQTTRTYSTLAALESDALNSRIWGGLHFRDAMVDAYAIGHTTARRVAEEIQ